jgi:hypothetical protein
MKKNIGTKDRLARLALAIILFTVSFFVDNETAKIVLIIISIIALIQSVIGWCGLYAILGKSTCPVK